MYYVASRMTLSEALQRLRRMRHDVRLLTLRTIHKLALPDRFLTATADDAPETASEPKPPHFSYSYSYSHSYSYSPFLIPLPFIQ